MSAESVENMSPAEPRTQSRRQATSAEQQYRAADGEYRKGRLIFPHFGPRLHMPVAIRGRHNVYRLRGAFALDVEYLEDETVCVSHRELPVQGFGDDLREALDDFGEGFDYLWRQLVEEDEDKLAAHGRMVRDRLRSWVHSSQPR